VLDGTELEETSSVDPEAIYSTVGDPSELEKLSLDEMIEKIGVTRFHHYASAILGLANAADATELLSIGYILPQLKEATDENKGNLFFVLFRTSIPIL